MTITIDTITIEGGGTMVVPGERDLQRATTAAERRAEQIRSEAATIENADIRQATLDVAGKFADGATVTTERIRAFRARHGLQIVSTVYPITPYSYGQKLAVRDLCTSYDNGVPVLNAERYYDELAALGLGMTDEQFRALAPAVAETLRGQVLEMLEPSLDKIDFLFSSPTSSPTGEASAASNSNP